MRPALLASETHAAFWISRDRTPMTAKTIQTQVFARTGKAFERAFGPHRMRHAIATTAALRAPDQPGLAADLLNISNQTVDGHYNRADQTMAAVTFAALMDARRRQSRGERSRGRPAG